MQAIGPNAAMPLEFETQEAWRKRVSGKQMAELLARSDLLLLLFVVPLARLGCLWARGPLQDCLLLHFWSILGSFLEELGGGI